MNHFRSIKSAILFVKEIKQVTKALGEYYYIYVIRYLLFASQHASFYEFLKLSNIVAIKIIYITGDVITNPVKSLIRLVKLVIVMSR